jgi:4,5-dihydroxyphthalate decarboxylase
VEKVDLKLPKGVKITSIPEKSLNGMLLSGEIDACLPPPTRCLPCRRSQIRRRKLSGVNRLLQETGIFPIMHAVAVP